MSPPAPNKRLLSLDVFRGATIAAMILVNNPVDWDYAYSQLRHANWNGWTFTDMIFPFFLFIIGVSGTFSLTRRKERGETDTYLLFQITRRSVILFALGLVLTSFPHYQFSNIRIPGVLQRIALCYFFTAWISLKSSVRMQACWTVALLLVYSLMLEFIPVPGVGGGVLEVGKDFASYIDSILLKNHLWSNETPWDPEGIVSTIPAIASTLFGTLTGHWLRSSRTMERKVFGMLVSGLCLIALGRFFGLWLPINKGLWTSSYSIFMAGWALVCFTLFYWVIDLKGYNRWSKGLAIYGMNPIAAYTLSILLDKLLRGIRWKDPDGHYVRLKFYLFDHVFSPVAGPRDASLLYSISFVLVVFVVVYIMYRKRWFLKI